MSDTEKQAVAIGRSREAALGVLLSRIFGAVNEKGMIQLDESGKEFLQVSRGNFMIRLHFQTEVVFLIVCHRKHHSVVFGAQINEQSSETYDEQIRVTKWDRSLARREWQAELFETFEGDAVRVPNPTGTKNVMPFVSLPDCRPPAASPQRPKVLFSRGNFRKPRLICLDGEHVD